MAKWLTFSKRNLTLEEISNHRSDVEAALYLYFSPASPTYSTRFFGYRPDQIRAELQDRLTELDFSSIFSILSAVEAAFQLDYKQRLKQKKSDQISIALRAINRSRRGRRPDFDEHILGTWKANAQNPLVKVLGELQGAYNIVRHWLAHGRYWVAKPPRKYDYATIYGIASAALSGAGL